MPHTDIKHQVDVRSKLKLESKTDYPFSDDGKDVKVSMETYVFLPRAIGINAQTYASPSFYSSLQTAFRLRLAATSLSGLASNTSPTIQLLKDAASSLAKHADAESLHELEIRHRLFGRLVSETLNTMLQRARNPDDDASKEELVDYFLTHASELACQLRAAFVPELKDTNGYAAAFATSDEHLSLALEQTSYELHYLLDQHLSSAPPIDGEPPVEAPNRQRLLALAAFSGEELAYRKQQNYPSIGSSKRNYENLVYRRNTLENHMTSVLYLSTRHKPDSTITRELLLSAAAGLAMIFATAVAFIAHVQYQNWTSTFFVILVISYMFKDRIKALTQSMLTHHSKRFFYQYKTRFYSATAQRPIGFKRETVDFVKARDLDPEILKERNRGEQHGSSVSASDETILRYKRSSDFNPYQLSNRYAGFTIDGITEVSRFDLTRFTEKMDDSKTAIFLAEGDGVCKIQGRRVYHLHVIVRAQFQGVSRHQHYCVVLNRGGVKRIVRY
jgi:hypothetical protein